MKFFCLCLSITVTVMFTGRITTSKRHCLNSWLLSIGESNLCSKSEVYTLCCYITWTDSTVIYVGLYQCWLNQFGIRLVLANDDQQQHNNEVSIHRATSPVWFVHWLAIHRASPVPIYAIWLYTGLNRTYYSSVFL